MRLKIVAGIGWFGLRFCLLESWWILCRAGGTEAHK
jgi:hypothetical protein